MVKNQAVMNHTKTNKSKLTLNHLTWAYVLIVLFIIQVDSVGPDCNVDSMDPQCQVDSTGPHPLFGQYTYVSLGEVICDKVGPGCLGIIRGAIHSWYQFDEKGDLEWYREDAVLGGQQVVFYREYANPVERWEYFLLNSAETSLQCTNLKHSASFNRMFPAAVYFGTGTFYGRTVYIWNDTMTGSDGTSYPTSLYVDVEREQFYGLSLSEIGGPTFIFDNINSQDSIDPAIFTRPSELLCTVVP